MSERQCGLRIVFVIATARRGGAEGQLVRLATELAGRGAEVHVLFTVGGGPHTEHLDAAGVRWEVLRSTSDTGGVPGSWANRAGRYLLSVARLARRLAALRPDVVSAWLPAAVWTTLPVAALVTRAVRVAAFRGAVHERELGRFAGPFRYAVANAHAVTVNAPSLRDEALRWGARPEQLTLIPNGVDPAATTAEVGTTPPTAVVVANFRQYKGHDVLMEALVQVEEALTVRLMGEGACRRSTAELAAVLGVADRVEFVEHPADVRAELGRAQFAIHPSRSEGMPNAVLEELAAGLPVVATDVGATGLLVEDGVNGFLVPPADPGQLAKRISELAAHPELRESMAAAARQRIRDFTWTACADSYIELFERATANRRSWR